MQEPKELYDLDFYKSLEGEKAVEERLKGRLPIIEIAGHPFFVDVNMGLLRPKDNFASLGLDMVNGGHWNEATQERTFYYDKRSMDEVKTSASGKQMPNHIVLVTVPGLRTLDPVGIARKQGLDPKTYLNDKPFRMFSTAKVTTFREQKQLDKVRKQFSGNPDHDTKTMNKSTKRKP